MMTTDLFITATTKKCYIPNDDYYIPNYIKDAELSRLIRIGDSDSAIRLIKNCIPVQYTHNFGFHYPEDSAGIRSPKFNCLTPLSGYLRCCLIALHPPKNVDEPMIDVILALLENLSNKIRKTALPSNITIDEIAELYDKSMMVPEEYRQRYSSGRLCLSDISLLRILYDVVPWKNSDRYRQFFAKLDENLLPWMKSIQRVDFSVNSWKRPLNFDDHIRMVNFSAISSELCTAGMSEDNKAIRQFIREDISTPFPYWSFDWFRTCMLAFGVSKDIFLDDFYLSPSKIVEDAEYIHSSAEYLCDTVKYPVMPYSPGSRSHYFARWAFARIKNSYLSPTTPPSKFYIKLNSDSRDLECDTMFGGWKEC